MSSDETQSALSRAFELVEAEKYDEARAILEPILAADKTNADAWWIYAHAVTDPQAGRDALEQVTRINPQYPGATDLLAQAQERFPIRPKIASIPRSASAPDVPQHLPETLPEPVAPKAVPAEPRPAGRSRLPLIAVLIVVIVVAGAAIFLLTQNNTGTPEATATLQVAALASETPLPMEAVTEQVSAATAEAIVTDQPPMTPTVITEATSVPAMPTAETPEMTEAVEPTAMATEASMPETAVPAPTSGSAQTTAESLADIEMALSAFPIAESGVGEVQTSLGDTLMVTACTTPGRAMRNLLPQIMNALALKSPGLSTVDAVGVRLLDCSANTPLLTVAVELSTAQSFAGGGMTSAAFAATWKPQ